jgi:anti-sigma factor RsiW
MRCFRARSWLFAYLDGELSERRRAALEDHLMRCSRCSAELCSSKKQWAGLANVGPAPSIPSDLWGHVIQALNEAERLPWYRLHRVQIFRAACVTACVALGFVSGALLSWRGPPADSVRPEISVSEEMLVAEAFDATAFGLGQEKEGLLRCIPK